MTIHGLGMFHLCSLIKERLSAVVINGLLPKVFYSTCYDQCYGSKFMAADVRLHEERKPCKHFCLSAHQSAF